jgi:hypothetical protein
MVLNLTFHRSSACPCSNSDYELSTSMLQHCFVHAMAFAERPCSVQRSKLAGIALVSVGGNIC